MLSAIISKDRTGQDRILQENPSERNYEYSIGFVPLLFVAAADEEP